MNATTKQILVRNIHIFLKQRNLLKEFSDFTPSETTGYVYDTSELINNLKKGVSNDNHSDASFEVCCISLKQNLNNY